MPDNLLRAVVVYRLKGKTVTPLAKYDHAGQTETHSSDTGTLYGSKERSFTDAVAAVVGKDPPGVGSEPGQIGGFKVVVSDMHQLVYGADKGGVCLAVISGIKYPSRVLIQMLTELHADIMAKYGELIPNIGPNALTKKAKKELSKLCNKYQDVKKVDKAQKVIGRVDDVKNQMASNIAGMLSNTEKASDIAAASEQLNEQAGVFKKNSNELKKQMRWKSMKTTIILVGVIIGVALCFLVPVILKAQKGSKIGSQMAYKPSFANANKPKTTGEMQKPGAAGEANSGEAKSGGASKKGSAKKGSAKKGSAKKGSAKKGSAKKGSAKKGAPKEGEENRRLKGGPKQGVLKRGVQKLGVQKLGGGRMLKGGGNPVRGQGRSGTTVMPPISH